MQHISLTNAIYNGQQTTAALPALTPDNIILLLNGQVLAVGADYQRTGSILTIDGDATGERLDVIVLDTATSAPIALTADYLLLQMLLAIKNMMCTAASSSSSSTTITNVANSEVDPLADLRQRLSAVQNQSISNVINTGQAL